MGRQRGERLEAFLEDEGLLEHLQERLEMFCAQEDLNEGVVSLIWDYLNHVKVLPTKATTRYGSAHVGRRELRITALEISPKKRRDTILHEVAHLVAYIVFGPEIDPHGREWRLTASALGAKPRAIDSDPVFEAAANRVRESRLKIVGRCGKCDYEILATRATQKYYNHPYRHRGCGGVIEPVEDPGYWTIL